MDSHYLTMDNSDNTAQPTEVYPYMANISYLSVSLTLDAVLHLFDSNSAEQGQHVH